MIFRETVEAQGRAGAGIIKSTPEYNFVRVLNSFEMYVSKADESVSPHLAREGFWESWITTWFMNNVRPTDAFFDVGAHTGYYSFLARYIGANVVSFEPNPFYANMIRKTASATGRRDFYLSVRAQALSDYEGTSELHVPTTLHGSGTLNTIPPGYEFDTIFVPVRSLDGIYENGITGSRLVFKIDAEGEEERVLDGGKHLIDKADDVVIMLEYTPGAYSAGFAERLVRDWHVSWINHSGFELQVDPDWITSQTDWQMLTLRRRSES